ncbi:MAG: hypothetical protein MR541_01410 [Prevotella sp.]|nr:hypothetical protein [Prevotella sp.]
MPFVTLHGITLVALVLIVVAGILMLSDGTPQQLMKEMIRHTVEQIMVRAQGI